MPSEGVNNLIRRFVQYFALLFIGLSHYLKNIYRENENARVAIDFVFSIFGGFKEIIYGEKSKLPVTEKWSEWISYDLDTKQDVDLFEAIPNNDNVPGSVFINKINSSVYLVNNDLPLEEVEPVKERFITVQYVHPHMGLPLTLEIPPGMYQKGNQILNSTFVYWCLKYQYQRNEYVFDENYKLEIIDGELNMFKMGSTQMIVLGGTNVYEVTSTVRR